MFMKKILTFVFAVALSLSGAFAADAFSKKGNAGNLEVTYSSAKELTKGVNHIKINVKEGGKEITDAKVNITVFMPAMPGMPAMDDKSDATYKDGSYQTDVEFSMGGTWQVNIVVETKDGKKQRLKSSVNL